MDGRKEGGREGSKESGTVTVKPAKNSHLLFPHIFPGIRLTLKFGLHKIYRHSENYRDTGGAEFTNSLSTR